MNWLRRLWGGRGRGQRRELHVHVAEQQCLRALFDARRSLSDDEVVKAVQAERPELQAMEIAAALLKLRQEGLVERDELARYRPTRAARGLRSIIPPRATSTIVYYG